MQPQITVALGLSKGTSIVTESIFENRFKYVDELTRMGANIKVEAILPSLTVYPDIPERIFPHRICGQVPHWYWQQCLRKDFPQWMISVISREATKTSI